MIEYEEDWLMKLLFKREGSVAAGAAVYGLFSASVAVLLLVAVELDTSQTVANILQEVSKSQLWNASTVVIAMLLGFRTKTAMSRFWEGTSLLHQMRGEWFDTVSNCVTFSIAAKTAKSLEVTRFRHTLVRLMSLCHATALEEIASSTIKLEAIDTFGLDKKTLKHLTDCSRKYKFNQIEIMVHLIQTLITAAQDNGVLKIPPPILSRVYQTLSRGFVNLLNAKKICDTRFPFPYAQMIAILLMFSSILTPLQIVAVVGSKFMAVVFTFVPVWGFVALNLVANQLEDPFGTDSNDLPLEHFQSEMNACLLMLLHPDSDHIPSIQESCTMKFGELVSAVQVADGPMLRYSHSFASQMSKRLSSLNSARASQSSDLDECDDIPVLRFSELSSMGSMPADVPLQHAQVPEAKKAHDAQEVAFEGFTVPTVPSFPIQCRYQLEGNHDDCKGVPPVSNCYVEQIADAAGEAAAPGRMPQAAPTRMSPLDAVDTTVFPAWALQVAPTRTSPADAGGSAATGAISPSPPDAGSTAATGTPPVHAGSTAASPGCSIAAPTAFSPVADMSQNQEHHPVGALQTESIDVVFVQQSAVPTGTLI